LKKVITLVLRLRFLPACYMRDNRDQILTKCLPVKGYVVSAFFLFWLENAYSPAGSTNSEIPNIAAKITNLV